MKHHFPITLSICLALAATILPGAQPQASAGSASPLGTQIDIVGPAGSGSFGMSVTVLPNGKIVVTDPYYDAGLTADVGAVYLYDGATGALISTLTGSTADDRVGSEGVTVLSNDNYVVVSRYWDNGGATDAGAVTWGDGMAGVSGVVSSTNSLVGSTTGDRIGDSGVTALSNGNYVVVSPYWDDGGVTNVGAVTWGDGTTGISGAVSSTNSLVGSTAGDQVGHGGVTPLSNGNYVVGSHFWDNTGAEHAAVTNAGAATWGNGTFGISGAVSSGNSLVGSTAGDWVGHNVTALSNGNYVVYASLWDNGGVANAGAVTWGNGAFGISGVVSSTNSLVGSTADDQVGQGVTVLGNGNYVVRSPSWDNGGVADVGAVTWRNGAFGTGGTVSSANSLVGSVTGDRVGQGVKVLSNDNYVVCSYYWDNAEAEDAGAVTWGKGAAGISGEVSVTNSLVGSTTNDRVGYGCVTALSNGNYVVHSPYWDNAGTENAGAATWGDGASGASGAVSSSNSLVGSTANDQVGDGVTALSNGNYVVYASLCDNGGVADVGAVTWGDGAFGTSGVVSSTNSLVGSTAGDQVGYVEPLSNGNYVVSSPYWDSGGATDVGAVTWGDGTTGLSGAVSSTNSLVGSTAGDQVGYVEALSNGNYAVSSSYWDNGGVMDVGAVTWGDGTTGVSGPVSSSNSLVGTTADDQIGDEGPIALIDGNYAVASPYWDDGGVTDAGAVTWGDGTFGVRGPVTGANSVRGTAVGGGPSMIFTYDPVNFQLVVGRSADNVVTLFRPYQRVFLPLVLRQSP